MGLHTLLWILLFLGIADGFLTGVLLQTGAIEEWNPIMRSIQLRFGIMVMVATKIVWHTLLVGCFYELDRRKLIRRKRIVFYVAAALAVYAMIVVPAYALVAYHALKVFF